MKTNKKSSLRRKERITGLLFITPIFLKVVVFTFFFMFYALYMSVTDWNILMGTKNFIGLSNFKDILQDSLFWKSLGNTVYLMLGIPVGMFLALLIAIALNRKLPGKNIFRVCIYLPAVTSAVAIVVLWRYIYNAEYGLLNLMIEKLTGLPGLNWLGDPAIVKISLIIMGVWKGLGHTMVLFLAGLQNVPTDYYEVIDVEGGNSLQKFRYVTLPMLSPVIFYVIITKVIAGLQAFGDQFIMTGTGPEHSAITVVYYLYQKGFAEYNMGAACAVSWILAIMIFVVTMIQFKGSNRWVYQG